MKLAALTKFSLLYTVIHWNRMLHQVTAFSREISYPLASLLGMGPQQNALTYQEAIDPVEQVEFSYIFNTPKPIVHKSNKTKRKIQKYKDTEELGSEPREQKKTNGKKKRRRKNAKKFIKAKNSAEERDLESMEKSENGKKPVDIVVHIKDPYKDSSREYKSHITVHKPKPKLNYLYFTKDRSKSKQNNNEIDAINKKSQEEEIEAEETEKKLKRKPKNNTRRTRRNRSRVKDVGRTRRTEREFGDNKESNGKPLDVEVHIQLPE